MKKVIFMVAIMALIFGGCAEMSVQEKVKAYKTVRAKVVKKAHVVKCEKDCILECNKISSTIDRVDCKATCVDTCHE